VTEPDRTVVPQGAATGIGSLPFTDARAAAALVLERMPELPFAPTLPQRDGAERALTQGFVGVQGVCIDADGTVDVDLGRLDPGAPVHADIDHRAFTGFRAFLTEAAGRTGPVKWQFTGPLTLGLTLLRLGAPPRTAFDVAVGAVRAHLDHIHAAVAAALPDAAQVVFLDEPVMSTVLCPGFPLPPDAALDLVSGALAALEGRAFAGIHCCSEPDVAALVAAGPALVSVPVHPGLARSAGYLARFLERGGVIAWGAVPIDGPVGLTAERHWRELSALWCELVQGGCDAARLRRQSLVTPVCGLANHDPTMTLRVFDLLTDLSSRVVSQAVATRLSLGA
jgi:hypothetical protein